MNNRIVFSENICHGQPRIAGTRVMVYQVLDLLASGRKVSEIISGNYFPDLTDGDVLACIAYASQIVRKGAAVPIPVSDRVCAMYMMIHKGYAARLEYSHEDDCFVGHIAAIQDVVGFHGDLVAELHEAFAEAVDDYLEACEQLGRAPHKP
jgi:uncharacterized protein (DUF433 family)/predicted RNase H-like HicB family nuclease